MRTQSEPFATVLRDGPVCVVCIDAVISTVGKIVDTCGVWVANPFVRPFPFVRRLYLFDQSNVD